MAILEMIREPQDLRNLRPDRLPALGKEIRQKLLEVVPQTGGHLLRSLECVELAIALHSVFNSPQDKIIWDTGSQAYAHKLLTNRQEAFKTMRQPGGLSEYPRRSESEHDAFGGGHPCSGLSAALGFAVGRDQKKEKRRVVAVINSEALTSGIVFEALQNAGQTKTGLIVILNDNQMTLSRRIGQGAALLARVLTLGLVKKAEKRISDFMTRIHFLGGRAVTLARRVKVLLSPGMLFQEMGFTYLGPVDGHEIRELIKVLQAVKDIREPLLLHVFTKQIKEPKITPALDPETGDRLTKNNPGTLTYSRVFAQTLCRLAEEDSRIVAITAATPESTGLELFKRQFPERFYDTGLGEQHAVTFAAGLACGGMKPVVVLHSTFLQRGFDQVFHDVALQKLPVVFCVDRAGLSAEDGPTHHGIFDLSYLRMIPHVTLIAPQDENELQHALKTAFNLPGPVAIRYPKGPGEGVPLDSTLRLLPVGRGETLKSGQDVALVAIGSMAHPTLQAAEALSSRISCRVINGRFVKPIDRAWLLEAVRGVSLVVTIEENVLSSGYGTAVRETLEGCPLLIRSLGLPDAFPDQGPMEYLRKIYGLTPEGIVQKVSEIWKECREPSPSLL
jgi:1-deoxy-D-xylulose-5-phosphate synthase